MKRLLLPLLAEIALPTAVNAEVEFSEKIHNRCKDANVQLALEIELVSN